MNDITEQDDEIGFFGLDKQRLAARRPIEMRWTN
jgi:hypothetical protein